MSPHEFEDRLEQVIEAARSAGRSDWRKHLPADLEAEVAADAELQRQLSDIALLDEAFENGPKPRPRSGFASHVVAQLQTTATPVSNPVQTVRWAAVGFSTVAAALLVAVTLVPATQDQPAGPSVVSTTPVVADETAVDVTKMVRHGTAAYVELVQSVASTVGSSSTQEVQEEPIELASSSPLSKAFRGSSETIRDAGEGFRVSVEPITNSALDAFGFLWKPTTATDDQTSI